MSYAKKRSTGYLGDHPGPYPHGDDMLRSAPLADLVDAVGGQNEIGHPIRHLAGSPQRVTGIAVTAKCAPGDNFAAFGALDHLFPGSILVIDNRGITSSCAGGDQLAIEAHARGAAAILVNGAWRDLSTAPTPIYGIGTAHHSLAKYKPGEVNVPVVAGGAAILPGDLVILDPDGCLCIPRDRIPQIEPAQPSTTETSAQIRSSMRELARTWNEHATPTKEPERKS